MKLKTERLLVDFFSSDYYKEYDELIHNLSPMLQNPPKNSRLVERLDFRQDLPRGAKTNIYQYIGEFLSLPNVVHPRHRKNDIIRWLTTNSNLNPSFASLKDDRIAMQEHCIIELEEVAAFEGIELAKLKALVTADKIKERPHYGRNREEKPRLASLCASTNERQILTDATGNRRWLCFMISDIDSPFEWTIDYDQLYAQLQKEYYDGFRYYFSKADEKRVTQLNRPFRVISPEEQMIVIRLRKPKKHEPFQLMSSEMINLFLNYGRHNNHFSNRKIGEIMTELDFECIHKRTGNYFKVVEIPLDHQQVYIASEDFDFEFEEADDDEAAEYQQLGLPL